MCPATTLLSPDKGDKRATPLPGNISGGGRKKYQNRRGWENGVKIKDNRMIRAGGGGTLDEGAGHHGSARMKAGGEPTLTLKNILVNNCFSDLISYLKICQMSNGLL